MDDTRHQPFGRYHLVRKLGQGGMAEVYLAEVQGPGGFRKRVAVKRLLPHFAANRRFVSMLRDEAHIAALIRHPHVGEVLDFGEVDGQHYIAMEFIDGVDLASVLRTYRAQGRRMPVAASVYVGLCVALGLEAAHQVVDAEGRRQEVIHRDVSPHNILVSYEGAVKLIDFGVAKAQNNSTKTRSGVIKGKLQYMSPEQAQARTIDARADVFSLGMSLYKMLTGRLPFVGQNEYQVYEQILRKHPDPPRARAPEVPEDVEALVLKALRKDPDRRYGSAGEMAAALEAALAALDPDFGARDLADVLTADAPRAGIVEQAEDEDDDFVSTVDSLPVPQAASDPSRRGPRFTRIEPGDEHDGRVTRIEASEPPAPRAASTPSGLSPGHGSAPSARPRAVPLPVPLPDVDPAFASDDEDDTTALPLPPTQALPLTDRATAPRIVVPPAEPEPASTPSLHTSALRAIGRRPLGALLLLLVGGVGLTGLILAFQRADAPARPSARQPVSVQPLARIDAAPPPLDAAVVAPVDAAVVDAAPPPVDAAPDATPDAAPLPDAAPDAAPPRRVVRRRPAKGFLTVNALPWAHVEVDGVRLADHTPVRRHALRAGTHTVTLVAPDGRTWKQRVVVRPGREHKLTHVFE